LEAPVCILAPVVAKALRQRLPHQRQLLVKRLIAAKSGVGEIDQSVCWSALQGNMDVSSRSMHKRSTGEGRPQWLRPSSLPHQKQLKQKTIGRAGKIRTLEVARCSTSELTRKSSTTQQTQIRRTNCRNCGKRPMAEVSSALCCCAATRW
jgi:hypothetical protein